MSTIRVRTFYPADPAGVVPGGIDTFIRGIIKWSPDDIEFSLIGITTDPVLRPVARWTRCRVGRREFDFFPVVQVVASGNHPRIPLSLRYTLATALAYRNLGREFDIFEFHRVEPGVLFRADPRPKNAFFHQNTTVIRTKEADILWKYLPAAYEAIEHRIMAGLASAWCVREDGVSALQARYPSQAETIRFIPTWVDTDVFFPLDAEARAGQRKKFAAKFNIDPAMSWIVSVGRLDMQKNPALLLAAFARLVTAGRSVALLLIGDGVLRAELESRVTLEGMSARVSFLGLRRQDEIAAILAASDVFALASAYEGMSMAILEALGCGLPVAATDVGEVRKTVFPGVNGALAEDHSVEGFAACLEDVLDHRGNYRGEPAVRSVRAFHPAEILKPVYDNYRELAVRRSARKLRETHG
ncbi:Glycosyltransferase involved in cell wall bisynthesis [Nitrosospira briensis]|uniref:Glycosyltransferase involved in cell wall bisynthesis n=1 Tax=Nitrosospira briensis TaxID=35799 RepID=A0A1I5BNY2_9PROT|nr:glycosyltransferase family 4 protein [Nitrosospira briensis]SFN76181.1 Glycosyltransferase involved in cell wall bisynthesis [Nitrosospira briensis]